MAAVYWEDIHGAIQCYFQLKIGDMLINFELLINGEKGKKTKSYVV